jgi:exosortase/archaeosortase family protein
MKARAKAAADRPPDIRRARLRFALIFAAVSGVLLAFYSFPYAAHGVREDLFNAYLSGYAWIAGGVLRLTDPSVHVAGTELVGRTSLVVAKNCDAMDVNILFLAAIVAFPAPWSRRAIGAAAGLGLLVVANVIRIVSLYHVAAASPRAFEFVHGEAWPLAMVALAVTAFLVWARWSARSPDAAG